MGLDRKGVFVAVCLGRKENGGRNTSFCLKMHLQAGRERWFMCDDGSTDNVLAHRFLHGASGSCFLLVPDGLPGPSSASETWNHFF